jgi:cupin 2 domain-containing protein
MLWPGGQSHVEATESHGMQIANLLRNLPEAGGDEALEKLLETADLRIERIVSHGHASPEGFWYDQDESEWIVLLSGAARLQFEDRTLPLGPGDSLNIAARVRHRVEWTSPDEPTVWLAVFYRKGS